MAGRTDKEKGLLTVTEVAGELGMTPDQVLSLVHQGTLKAVSRIHSLKTTSKFRSEHWKLTKCRPPLPLPSGSRLK